MNYKIILQTYLIITFPYWIKHVKKIWKYQHGKVANMLTNKTRSCQEVFINTKDKFMFIRDKRNFFLNQTLD